MNIPQASKSPRQRRTRSDTRRNKRRLLEAAGEIARNSPNELTMQAIASRAEIGLATAYRYYSTMDDVLTAYMRGLLEQLREVSEDSRPAGRSLFDRVLLRWLELVDEHGAAVIQLRSRRGFLERLHSDEEVISAATQVWHRPVLTLLDSLDLPADMIESALFLSNIMFDPREVHDLRTEAGMSREEVAERLTAAYVGALLGWARR